MCRFRDRLGSPESKYSNRILTRRRTCVHRVLDGGPKYVDVKHHVHETVRCTLLRRGQGQPRCGS